jgi:hypothetical protein
LECVVIWCVSPPPAEEFCLLEGAHLGQGVRRWAIVLGLARVLLATVESLVSFGLGVIQENPSTKRQYSRGFPELSRQVE